MITIAKKYAEEIKQVCQAAASRASIQAFENIYIHADESGIVKLKAGDSMIEITRMIAADKFESGFETTVNAPKFLQAFNACSGDVQIIVKDKMTIKSGKRRFTLPVISAESYPAYPEMDDAQKVECDGFIETVKQSAWAAGKNDVRYVMNGVYISKDAVGTNGHKMAVTPIGLDCDIILPIETINKIPDIDGDIYISDSVMAIKSKDVEFKTKLIDGRYPDYKRAIPSCDKTASVDLDEFKSAVKAAQITANSQFKTIVMSFGDECSISATSSDKREDSSIGFECDCSDSFEFAVNSSYLLEALNELTLPNVELQFSDGMMMIEEAGKKLIICSVRL